MAFECAGFDAANYLRAVALSVLNNSSIKPEILSMVFPAKSRPRHPTMATPAVDDVFALAPRAWTNLPCLATLGGPQQLTKRRRLHWSGRQVACQRV